MKTAYLLLITLALCSALVASQGTDVTIRLFTDFGILGDPSPSNIGAVTASPTGSAYMLARVETPAFEGWYTACALSFSNFPFFGISVDIYGPLVAIGDTTDDSVIFYYVNGFVPTGTTSKDESFIAREANMAEDAMGYVYGEGYYYQEPQGYEGYYEGQGYEGEGYGGEGYGGEGYGGEGYGGEGYGGEGYGGEGYGYGGEGYGYGGEGYGYGGEGYGYGGEGYGYGGEGYGYGGEGYGYGGEGYGYGGEGYGYGGEGEGYYFDPYGWGPGYQYDEEYIPYEWTPYGGYGGTDADEYEYGEEGYGGYGGYDYNEPPPVYSSDYPGFYYWNSLIPGSWIEDRVAATVPEDDALICGFRNETSGEGRQFYVQFTDFLAKDTEADFDNTSVEERLGCRLCAFGQRLTIGQQFVATTCNQPCIAEIDETESAECTMVCIIPTGTAEFQPVLALPTYQGDIDKTVEGQANRYFTALDSYSSFLVSAGCFLERKATGFNKNIGGFSPVIMLCKMNGRGGVNENSCDRGPFRVLQNEELNQCPSSVAVYGEDKKAQYIALGFSSRNAVYVFELTPGVPFTSQQLRSWQKITLDETTSTPGFGHTVSFSANDEVFGGTLPDKRLLAVGAFGDVGNSTGATFIFSNVQDEDPDDVDLSDCPTTNSNCFFVMTPATMSSYNYPTGFSYGFAAEMDAESVALVTVDLSTGFWEFDSFPECDPGEQFTDVDCFPCPTGQFSDEKSYNPCELCAAGSFNPRSGSSSESACLPCNRGEFCAAGARVPIEQRYADEQVYAFNNPDPEASPQLHFETTFFFSVVPPALILGVLIIVFFLPFLCSCLYRFSIFRNFRSVVCAINLIDDADDDLLSSFFTVWLILSTVFLIVFAILFATKVNDSLELTLKTLDDTADLEDPNDLTLLDEVPFQISVAFIGLADYLSCDDKTFEVEIDGCFYDDERCSPDVHYKQSRLEPTGARICNVTFGFQEGTLLDRTADFAIKTRPGVKRFYTQMVWWKAATINDDDTDIGGNSYISGEVQPLTGTILRGRGDVAALTTLTPLMDCRQQELNWVTFLLVTSEANCEFVPEDSLKSFSHLVNKTQDASVDDFYLPNKLFEEFEGYDFHVTLEKGRYYLLKQEAFYVTNAQIFILVVLLIFGFWWGFLQLIKFLIDRCYGAGKDCCGAVAS